MTVPTRAQIEAAVGRKFATFGGGVGSEYNPIAEALKDRPLTFAAGVSVAEVVDFVITAAEVSPLRDQVAGIGRADYPPSQAQIEADAMAALRNEYEFQKGRNPSAAAGIAWAIEQIERLTATAEAGEQDKAVDAFNGGYKQAWENATAATVERCAQVADNEGDKAYTEAGRSLATKIAAAIRARKEEIR